MRNGLSPDALPRPRALRKHIIPALTPAPFLIQFSVPRTLMVNPMSPPKYPAPALLPRLVYLSPTTPARPLFRPNLLNPRLRWNLPVPTLKTEGHARSRALVFDKYVVPLTDPHGRPTVFLDALVATAAIPPDADPFSITYDPPPDTDPLAWATHQVTAPLPETLAELACHITTPRLLARPSPPDAIAAVEDRLAAKSSRSLAVLKVAACRIGIPVPTLVNLLNKYQGIRLEDSDVPNNKGKRTPIAYKFARTDPRMQEVKDVVAVFRTAQHRKTPEGVSVSGAKFKIDDLATPDPGGFPTRCPVTDLSIEWGHAEGQSTKSPRIGRYRVHEPHCTGNVLFMTKLGRIISEGRYAVDRVLPYISDVGILYAADEWFKNTRAKGNMNSKGEKALENLRRASAVNPRA